MKNIYYIPYFTQKVYNKLCDFFNDWCCKNSVVFDNGVDFRRTARVDNLSKNKNNISIGKFSIFRGELLVYRHSGKIVVGDYCYLGENSKIWSAGSVTLGNRVLISHNVNIHDNNSHPLDPELRFKQYLHIITEKSHPTEDDTLNEKPVVIEDDVWIGFNSTILKGVTIGKGSIIAACTLIVKDVPPHVVIGGNPAKIIKYLK